LAKLVLDNRRMQNCWCNLGCLGMHSGSSEVAVRCVAWMWGLVGGGRTLAVLASGMVAHDGGSGLAVTHVAWLQILEDCCCVVGNEAIGRMVVGLWGVVVHRPELVVGWAVVNDHSIVAVVHSHNSNVLPPESPKLEIKLLFLFHEVEVPWDVVLTTYQ
jgi:hypothetical protein